MRPARRIRRSVLASAGSLLILLGLLPAASAPALAVSPDVVISEVYGGGGNSGATLKNDFIELYNRGSTPVSVAGWSVQYASSAGSTWQVTALTGSIVGGGRYLVQEAAGAGGTTALPPPDATGSIPMSATSGKVALVTNATPLNAVCGADCDAASGVRDYVGYGASATDYEGTGPTATLSNTTSASRTGGGATDTDNNAADFAAGQPSPVNSGPPGVVLASPANGATGVAVNASVSVTFSESVTLLADALTFSCSPSGPPALVDAGPATTFTVVLAGDLPAGATCTIAVDGSKVRDADSNAMPGTFVATFVVASPAPAKTIREIQGSAHVSPLVGTAVTTTGIVTARTSTGFWIQDPAADTNDATSEALLVATSSAPTANVGDAVRVSGSVVEIRPGGASSTNLTITELTSPTVVVLSTGNALPATTVIGTGGRVPPAAVIEDDATGDVETSGVFDPTTDGIDFYESLEGMRVQVNNPVVVGPRNGFGEAWVLPDDGAAAAVRTTRGGIVIRSADFNPERIQLDDAVTAGSVPAVNVGDHFTAPAVGVLHYDFGNYEIDLTTALTAVGGGLTRETAAAPAAGQLSIATFNVENLDPGDGPAKFDALAEQIVVHLLSPDVIALEEIQDNTGPTNDGTVAAGQTLDTLVAAISAAGGPAYQYRLIDPVNNQDGGEPGGNIRVGFLFRTDRGLAFVDRAGGTSTAATTVVDGIDGPELSFSPGRIAPADAAWSSSRKPLAAEFTYRGETFFMIANHFNSKGGDQPLFGRFQPPARSTETQRHQQAALVNGFVDQILAFDANANVVVLGDINDFEFSDTMSVLAGGSDPVLVNLMTTLPQSERYSYVFDGNSQSLDHILVSNALATRSTFDPVHVNAEFHDQLSDHDPSVVLITGNQAPTVDAGGPYTVAEGGSVGVSATAADSDGDTLTVEWDLDADGTYETSGSTASFDASAIDGPASRTIGVRVSDGGLSTTDTATVSVTNADPVATLQAPASTFAGSSFTVALINPSDAGAADTFTYAFDCGDGAGYGSFTATASRSCPTSDTGSRTVKASIRDDDGGTTEYTAGVSVVVTYDSLCDLGAALVSRATYGQVLCATLQAAEAADGGNRPLLKNALLAVYRFQVDAIRRLGGLTSDEATLLRILSTRL